ncbi:alpha/beta hydrolase [Prauserella cavernicola]|nr:alpha/beta hydrolase [Prauserella cavernicola]
MTDHATGLHWSEPDGINPRATLVVLPGRGERPAVYERFGRRLSADGYRVHALGDASVDPEAVTAAVKTLLADDTLPAPHVLIGSDTGALLASRLQATGTVRVAGLVLAGLPSGAGQAPRDWDEELASRTACPAHRKWISDEQRLTPGALAAIPETLRLDAELPAVDVPVLGVHGAEDPLSPLAGARARYARLPRASLVAVAGGRHDALNDATHRIAAARIVLFVEELLGNTSEVLP